MNEDSVFKPKKRIFMALTSISAVLGALMFYVVWKVTFPGLYEISRFLPIVFGFFGVLIVLAMLSGVLGWRCWEYRYSRFCIFGRGRRLIFFSPLR